MNISTNLSVSIDDENVTLEDLIKAYKKPTKPLFGARAYATYGINDSGHFFKHALWHSGTKVGHDEIQVAGFFVPDVRGASTSQELNINEWQQRVRETLLRLGHGELFDAFNAELTLDRFATQIENLLGMGDSKDAHFTDDDDGELEVTDAPLSTDSKLVPYAPPVITPQVLMLQGRRVQAGDVLYDVSGVAHNVLEVLDPKVYGAGLKLFISEHGVGVNKYENLHDTNGKQQWFWSPRGESLLSEDEIARRDSCPAELVELLGEGHHWKAVERAGYTEYTHPRGIVMHRKKGQDEIQVLGHPMNGIRDNLYANLHLALNATTVTLPSPVTSPPVAYLGGKPVIYGKPLFDAQGYAWTVVDVNADQNFELIRTPDAGALQRWHTKVEENGVIQLFPYPPRDADPKDLGMIRKYIDAGLVCKEVILSADENPDGQWRSWLVTVGASTHLAYRWRNQVQIENTDVNQFDITEHPDPAKSLTRFTRTTLKQVMQYIQEQRLPSDKAAPAPEPELPTKGEMFIHTDGGYYRFYSLAKSTQDQSPQVIYEHVWPFEPSVWSRPLDEWNSRFTKVESTTQVFPERERYQELVSQRRAKRKEYEASLTPFLTPAEKEKAYAELKVDLDSRREIKAEIYGPLDTSIVPDDEEAK